MKIELNRLDTHPLARLLHDLMVEWEKVPGSTEQTNICTEIGNLRERMQALLNQPRQVGDGATHVHYKGGRYRKICEARLEADPNTWVVIYRSIEKGYVWARAKDEFDGPVTAPRFKPL